MASLPQGVVNISTGRTHKKLSEITGVPQKQLEGLQAQRQIKNMEESLRKAPDLAEFSRMRAKSEELEKAERDKEYLKGQIVIKDQQIDKQAFSLQSVIQENSRLNVKLLPETTEIKKPWWQFW